MEKKLGDYTLSEIKDICKKNLVNHCKNCKFSNICSFYNSQQPRYWSFFEGYHFSNEEVEQAKAIKALYPNAYFIKKTAGWILIYSRGVSSPISKIDDVSLFINASSEMLFRIDNIIKSPTSYIPVEDH